MLGSKGWRCQFLQDSEHLDWQVKKENGGFYAPRSTLHESRITSHGLLYFLDDPLAVLGQVTAHCFHELQVGPVPADYDLKKTALENRFFYAEGKGQGIIKGHLILHDV